MPNSAGEVGGSTMAAAPTANRLSDMPTSPASRTGLRPRRSTTLARTTTAIVAMLTSPLRNVNSSAVTSETPKPVSTVGA